MRQPSICLSQVFSCYRTLVAVVVIIMSSGTESTIIKKIFVMKGKTSGSFSSPSYPKQYPENVSYMWIFPKYEHDVVLLEFVDMNLYRCYVVDPDENCYVYDHIVVEGFLPFCNWRVPNGVLTLRQRTTIEFRTFLSKKACRGRGFNATFKVVSATIHDLTTQEPRWLSTDNRSTEGGKEAYNAVKTIVIAIGTIVLALVVLCLILCCWCWNRKKRQRHNRRHRTITRSYSSIPEQEGERSDAQQREGVRYSDLLRNEDRSTPRVHGPPPAYDSVFNTENTSRRENSTVADFEHPPSYETAMREPLNSERQTNRTANTSRGNRNAQRIPGDEQGNGEDRSVRSHQRTVNTSSTDGQITNTNTDSAPVNRTRDSPNHQTGARKIDGSPRPRNSRHSRARTRDDHNNESTNQRRPDSTSQPTNNSVANSNNQSDYMVNTGIAQSSDDSQEAENQQLTVTESSTNPPDNSNREVFV